MEIKSKIISIGASEPFSVLHVTDTHLVSADERDNERKNSLAQARKKYFVPSGEEKLKYATDYARKNSLTIVHTGDLIDFVSEMNLEKAKEFISGNDVLFVAGNHEFSLYVGEAFEDEAYRNQSISYVSSFFKDDIRFNSRIIGGVNFVGIDNGYYLFEKEQIEMLKNEVSKGLPIVLLLHTPLYEKSLCEYALEDSGGTAGYVVAAPEEFLKLYPEDRYIQQKADKITEETVEYIKNEKLIKCILAGHMHFDFESCVTPDLPQFVTGMTTIRRIDFI